MSVQAMSYVIEKSKEKGGALLCLIMIANYADRAGRNSYASFGRLAKDCRMSVRQIVNIVAQLETNGSVEIKRSPGGRLSNVFRVVMDLPDEKISPPGETVDKPVDREKGVVKLLHSSSEILPPSDDANCIAAVKRFSGTTENHEGTPPIRPTPSSSPSCKDAEPAAPGSSVENKTRKLDPEVQEIVVRIVKTDPKKFKRLVVWIKGVEAVGYLPSWIATALRDFEQSPAFTDADDWWPYLDKVAKKARTRFLQEHAQKKFEPQGIGLILDALKRVNA